jgi:hypothetical protein
MTRAAAMLVAALFAISGAFAQDKERKVSEKQAAQQERMKSCNAQASKKGLKGDERQNFMSDCLKGESQLTAQQQKMKSCNAQANRKELKGEVSPDI